MKNFKVSYYESCKSKKNKNIPFQAQLSRIKSGEYEELINELRALPSKLEMNKFKTSKLPAFTYSVNCNGPHNQKNIDNYLGVIGIDYDNVENPEQLKEKVIDVDTTMAAFISPSGNGLKVFVKVDSDQADHKKAFKFVNDYYADLLQLDYDPSVKDLTRLCFVSHDTDAYINDNYKTFNISEALKLSNTNDTDINHLFNNTMLGFHKGNRHNVLVSCAGKANRYGINKDEVISFFSSHTDQSFNIDEVSSEVNDVYERYSHQWNTTTTKAIQFINHDWLNYEFTSKTTNDRILKQLSKDIAVVESTGDVFRLNKGNIDFENRLNHSDFIMKLEDVGIKKSDNAFKRLMSSESVKKITPFNLFLQRVKGNPWDGIDRISALIMAAKLEGCQDQVKDLITRWLCTAYSYAMRDIDNDIHYNSFSRVVLILFSKKRALGKTTFFQKLGMLGEIKKKSGINGLDIYSEFPGHLSRDERELKLLMESNMIIQIDDIDNALINDNGTLRSVISKNNSDDRELYSSHIKNREWRGVLCGSTNHMELVRDKEENRYLIFKVENKMDFDELNKIDFIQLWSQIRFLCLKENDFKIFDTKQLEIVRELAQPYVYTSIEDNWISEYFEFDPEGRLSFKEIQKYLISNEVHLNINKIGSGLSKLAPNDGHIKVKITGNYRYKVNYKARDRGEVMNSEPLDLYF